MNTSRFYKVWIASTMVGVVVGLICTGCSREPISSEPEQEITSRLPLPPLHPPQREQTSLHNLTGMALLSRARQLAISDPGAILDVFGTRSWEEHRGLLEILDQADPQRVLPGLVRKTLQTPVCETQPALLWKVIELAARTSPELAIIESRNVLNAAAALETKRRALIILCCLAPQPQYVTLLRPMLDTDDPWKQWELTFAIGQIAGDQATAMLIDRATPQHSMLVATEALRQLVIRQARHTDLAANRCLTHPDLEVQTLARQAWEAALVWTPQASDQDPNAQPPDDEQSSSVSES